ncbi:MAG: hypothetical protein ACFFG0_05455 [Candidatus Thorarchaeota archaeon]
MNDRIEELKKLEEKYKLLPKENLEILIYFRTPFSIIGNIHFDALLSFCVVRDLLGDEFYNYQGSTQHLWDIPLPLDTRGSDHKYWAASRGVWEGKESITSWKKRFDTKYDDYVTFGKKKPCINHKFGHFKAYDMPLVIHATPFIKFYANGNKKEIVRLLGYLHVIGKKTSQGFGWLKKIETKSIENDYSCFFNNIVMRAIPEIPYEIREGMRIEYTGYRPPYWSPKNQKMCLV